MLPLFLCVALASAAFTPAVHPSVKISGRYRNASAGGVEFDWAGVTFTVNIRGVRSLQVEAYSNAALDVFFDNDAIPSQVVYANGKQAVSLRNGATFLRLLKRNEPSISGICRLVGFHTDGNLGNANPFQGGRSIEFIGDSISVGYGNVGPAGCQGNGNPNGVWQDNGRSWVTLVARGFGADHSTIAWSGRGVIRNYGGPVPSPDNMSQTWVRTLGNVAQNWDFRRFNPKVVVINLGTNDYSTAGFPSQQQFEQGYGNLIRDVKSRYPGTRVFLAAGYLGNNAASYVQNVARNNGAVFIDTNVFSQADWGCDAHPNTNGDIKIAKAVSAAISREMRW